MDILPSTIIALTEPGRTVTVLTSDGQAMDMTRAAASMARTLEDLLNDLGEDSPIPIPSVNAHIMRHVIEYAEYKVHNPNPAKPTDPKELRRTDDILPWDRDFIAALDQSTLFDVIMAANYLSLQDLVDLGCKSVANMIKGKSVEELRETFHLKNEFTPEEEKKVREENEWCDERQ